MKYLGLPCVGLAALMLVLAPARAADSGQETPKPAKAGKPAKQKGLTGIYAEMVKALKLSDEQAAKLNEKVQAKQAALKKWEADNKAALEDNKKAVEAAKSANDKEALKKASDARRQLMADREKVAASAEAEIMSVLTPEQQLAWEAYELDKGVCAKLSKAELTDDQKAKIQALANDAAKELSALKADDKKGQSQIRRDLLQKAKALLTEDQKAKLTGPMTKRARQGKEAPKPVPAEGTQ